MKCLPALLAALITLHQPGGAIFVNPDEIMLVKAPGPDLVPRKFKASVLVHDTWVHVLETPAEVKRLRDGD